jgi:ABC-type nitrate/sulfonate/bicarbonate transport system substrate-binding protein
MAFGCAAARGASDPHTGVFVPTVCPPDTRRAVLILRVLSSIIVGRNHPLTTAMARADQARDDALGALTEALAEAAHELERLPALRRRQLISSFAGNMLIGDDAKQRGRPAGRYEAKAERKKECAA